MSKKPQFIPPKSVQDLLDRQTKPSKVVITSGMPYANGPIHLGHLAGAHVPADVSARYHKMLIGEDNVLYVCGTDDHGSNSEVAAIQQGSNIHDFIESIHTMQKKTMDAFSINLDVYTGTSAPETFEVHKATCHEFMRNLQKNNMLQKRSSMQWFDTKLERFLPDRYVTGTCPKEDCGNEKAYSNECEVCGTQYDSSELKNPKSALSDEQPELKSTDHLWLDMWKTSPVMLDWIKEKKRTWRKGVYNEVINTVLPCLWFNKIDHEEEYKTFKNNLPKHKSRYAPGKRMVLQFESYQDMEDAKTSLSEKGIKTDYLDDWAHRSITRDVSWGIPIPEDVDANMQGKTMYVWPDSLIAPISFSKIALKNKGKPEQEFEKYWKDPDCKIMQFLGQDNVFFYVLMQGSLWIGSQSEINRPPQLGEFQLTDVIGSYMLNINGSKMSKSLGNFYTGDEMLHDKNYHPDQIRYQLCLLSLAEKSSNFDFDQFDERNAFLAGPLNAAFEKPQSAAHKKFASKVPDGNLMEKVEKETMKIVQRYLKQMEKAEYSTLLFALENYARQINSLFTQFKPHDDRADEQGRKDSLYSCFYILKNLMVMYYPFVPETMDKLRKSLNLPESVFTLEELGKPFEAGHQIGEMLSYFPAVDKDKENT